MRPQPSLAENQFTRAAEGGQTWGGASPALFGAAGLLRKDLTLNGYDYANQPWFTTPVQTMAAVWSEPYFDAGGGEINMVTYAAPVVKDGVIIGVLTADFGPLATAP